MDPLHQSQPQTDRAQAPLALPPRTFELVTAENSVCEHRVALAAKTIIHVDIIHYPTNDIPGNFDSVIQKFRGQSVLLTQRFAKEYSLKSIAADGMTAAVAKSYNEAMPLMRPILLNPFREQEVLRSKPEARASIEDLKRQYRLIPAFRAACELKLSLIGLENPDLMQQAAHVLTRAQSLDDPELVAVKKSRENAMLENSARLPGNAVLIMLGAGHSLVDQISEWNAAHPKSQYSLIEARLIGTPLHRNELADWIEQFHHP